MQVLLYAILVLCTGALDCEVIARPGPFTTREACEAALQDAGRVAVSRLNQSPTAYQLIGGCVERNDGQPS